MQDTRMHYTRITSSNIIRSILKEGFDAKNPSLLIEEFLFEEKIWPSLPFKEKKSDSLLFKELLGLGS